MTGFQASRWLPGITAGLVIGIMGVISQISYAALIFSGPLTSRVSHGVGLILLGGAVITVLVTLTSTLPCAIAMPQDSPAAILALVSAAISRSMVASASADAVFFTTVAAIGTTSLCAGAFFYLLGQFRLGRLVRFVPYPVIGGFLAGTGWLLTQGSIGVMTGTPFVFSQPRILLEMSALVMWVPGTLLAVLLIVVLRRHAHFLIVPSLLVSALVAFYGLLWAVGIPLAEANTNGWLLGSFSGDAQWEPMLPAALAQVDWSVIAGQMDKIGTILIVGVIGLLLNTTALELAARQDIDLNRELKAAGIANLVAGLTGTPPGYHTLSFSALAFQMGSNSRLVGLVAAAFSVLVLWAGASFLSFLPRPILGGLLLFQGLYFLIAWLYDAWFHLPRTDYMLVVIILVSVVGLGYLQGVAVGIGIAMLLFVVNYSRTRIVRHVFTGATFHSPVDRPAEDRRVLRERANELYILRLQGFVFFGTAISLLNQVHERLAAPGASRPRLLVLDFGRVDGLDSSAVSSFLRMKQLTDAKGAQLVLAGLTHEMRRQLERGGLAERAGEIRYFATLDQGVEWCEDTILANAAAQSSGAATQSSSAAQDGGGEQAGTLSHRSLPAQLEQVLSSPAQVDALMRYLERIEVGGEFCLMRQGEPSDAFYFIESGRVTAQLESADGKVIRLRTMRAGTVVGEVGLYLRSIRTASAFTTEPSTLFRLSAKAIQAMETQDPELAAALHHYIARLLAERLADNNNMLAAMMD